MGPGAAVAASHLTDAALKKAQRIRGRSVQYDGATNLSFTHDDEVRATVQVSVHASVAVRLCRASPDTEPEVECTCRQPQDRGMPCKHAIAVFRALQQQAAAHDRPWDRLDECWFADVWHTSTWRLQYDAPFVVVDVRRASSPLDPRPPACAPYQCIHRTLHVMYLWCAGCRTQAECGFSCATKADPAARTAKEAANCGTRGTGAESVKVRPLW